MPHACTPYPLLLNRTEGHSGQSSAAPGSRTSPRVLQQPQAPAWLCMGQVLAPSCSRDRAPVPRGGVPVTVPAQSHLRWSCGGAQPGARARVSLGWSRDAHRASQMLLLRLFPLFLLSELQPRHPSSELRAGGSSAAAGRGRNKNKKARTKRESSYQLYQYPLEPVKGWDREGQFILRRRRAVPELFTARSEHDSKRECRIKPNENRGQLTRRGHCLPKPQVAELFH